MDRRSSRVGRRKEGGGRREEEEIRQAPYYYDSNDSWHHCDLLPYTLLPLLLSTINHMMAKST